MLRFLLFLFSAHFVQGEKFLLDGNDWKFRLSNNSISGSAIVPGDIYTDLLNNGIINHPLYGNGDQDYKWVGWYNWTYEKIFTLPSDAQNNQDYVLVFDSIDTIVTGYLNDIKIFNSSDQFLPVHVSIKNQINPTDVNNLTLVFESPVNHAKMAWYQYKAQFGHDLPPDDQTGTGEQHVNFLRKTQSSFSWDWGPTIATMGVAGSAYIYYFNEAEIFRVSPLISYQSSPSSFQVKTDVLVFCTSGSSIDIKLSINDTVRTSASQTFSNLNCQPGVPQNLSLSFNEPDANIQRWWPNGYGPQTLYNLTTQVVSNGKTVSQRSQKVGFRTIENVQDPVNPQNSEWGLTFYFKVNDVPIFLKGSNYIPISVMVTKNNTLRREFLLKSLQVGNMNVLRIWGGGQFEADEFYEMADEYGILLWHDMMFACSTYPNEDYFKDMVKLEVTSQITRLRYHPSILAWAGNNENEWAVLGWWKMDDYNKTMQVADYIALNEHTIKPIILSMDNRPFIPSSPSNGKESEAQGGVARGKVGPGSQLYGDTHYYAYSGNLWEEWIFIIPRCGSEYGSQSLPLTSTMSRWVPQQEWTYGSSWLTSRQHHPNGNHQNLGLIFQHFEIPNECAGYTYQNLSDCKYAQISNVFIDDFAYLSQVHQAIAMQTESEHYRRYRSILDNDGRGLTMCALYWQINDVWAAPTWASIDYDLNWKVLHYYARKFFAPVIVSMYVDKSNNLNVYVISDLQQPLNNYQVKLDVFTWQNRFTPIYTSTKTVNVPALNASSVDFQSDLTAQHITLDNNDGFLVRATLYDSSNNPASPTNVLHPQKLRQISNTLYGNATVTNVAKIDPSTFSITLSASNLVPFLWIDLKQAVKDKYQLLYWFSDNGFTMTDPTATVQLHVFSSNDSVVLSTQDFIVSRIKMTSSTTCPPNWIPSNVDDKTCYGVINQNLAWSDANQACTSVKSGATLVSIDNGFENSEINGILKTTSECSEAYIDLVNSNGNWVWSNGDGSTYRTWESGYPNNVPGNTCTTMKQSDGKWANEDCTTPRCYICKVKI